MSVQPEVENSFDLPLSESKAYNTHMLFGWGGGWGLGGMGGISFTWMLHTHTHLGLQMFLEPCFFRLS